MTLQFEGMNTWLLMKKKAKAQKLVLQPLDTNTVSLLNVEDSSKVTRQGKETSVFPGEGNIYP